MAKGIIMVDMPEDDCRECIFCWEVKSTGQLQCAAKLLQDVSGGRPGWCPVKPVPERITDRAVSLYEYGYKNGYNRCINDILVGNGKNEKPDEKREKR